MLQIKDIHKQYKTGGLVQKALDGVSLNLRDNEFVAILGPSGSGKTTLLNIIGGLDRYDSGDLVINGTSTKQYKDRDWDAYRNHTIGFVFQSYNLIPHQTVLSNVELALTIGGISKGERRRKAQEALRQVGLGDQMHKRPSQMSGGQMQRVAIARALVNDPDILLADEPTGALDSETSVQVMELLKEVAKDRLVVMVTHNPELAERYATRTVRLRDGKITSDSDPYLPADVEEAVHRKMGRASMSFLTALALSFNNLRTKFTRTILVAFAGSIGIIGIACILSLSNGVNLYIQSIEEETLSEYPMQITSASFNFLAMMESAQENASYERSEGTDVLERRMATNLFSRMSANDLAALRRAIEADKEQIMRYANAIEYRYQVVPLIYRREGNSIRQVNPDLTFQALGFGNSTSIFSTAMATDIFNVLPEDENMYVNQYDVKAGHWPQNSNECVLIVSGSGRISDLVLYTLGLKDAAELDELVKNFAAGQNTEVSNTPLGEYKFEDFLGIEFKRIRQSDCYLYDSEYHVWTDKSDDPAYMKKLVLNGETLTIVGVVMPREDASAAMLLSGIGYPASLVRDIIQETADSEIIRQQLDDPTVNVFTQKPFGDESERQGLNMETLFKVDEEALAKAFSFDTDQLDVDTSDFLDPDDLDMSDLVDTSGISAAMPSISAQELSNLLNGIKVEVSTENLGKLFQQVMEGYMDYAAKDPSTDYSKLGESVQTYLQTDEARALLRKDLEQLVRESNLEQLTEPLIRDMVQHILEGYQAYAEANGISPEEFGTELQTYLDTPEGRALMQQEIDHLTEELSKVDITDEQIRAVLQNLSDGYDRYAAENGLPEPSKISESFREYLQTDEGRKLIQDGLEDVVNLDEIEKQMASGMNTMFYRYGKTIASTISSMMTSMTERLAETVQGAFGSAMESIISQMDKAFQFDADSFADAISLTMNEKDLQELLTSLTSSQITTYENNLKKLGYGDLEVPYEIDIYPRNFESKNELKAWLDAYNARMEAEDQKEKVIRYTDAVGTLMSSVTEIVNAISIVLIVFVAISLVVSSIMIGVITYISVLERRKEIGILRAIGASKHNISNVFNAETFIIGLLAGLIGVGVTLLILIPGNQLLQSLTGRADIYAFLPVDSAAILVVLSIILTLIGGLIPSRKAAKSDPVAALRTE
ncbi:MAG: ABC transporter ATP-binding protein/permease [Firmicutes bacterium]|nr:ABC transporter ATP-binding protein/permease [Bacillota bacterium]